MSFKALDPEDLVISSEAVTTPVWSNNVATLTTFFTSSVQAVSSIGAYYIDVYQTGSTSEQAEIQFSIAYCDNKGSGSVAINSSVSGSSPSSINYKSIRTLTVGDEESEVSFGDVKSDYFYSITFDRSRYKERLLPGTLSLTLTSGGNTLVLSDISSDTTSVKFSDAGRVYELKASGSAGLVTEGSPLYIASGSYGKLFPDIGLILLNGKTLDAPIVSGGLALGIGRNSNTNDANATKLFNSLSSFKLSCEETISSNFVFVRARNSEFNYSTNPSYITGSGELRHNLMIDDPRAYFTAVGLYNDNNDLLAVAKLSRPLLKDSRKEALVRIKLNY